MDLLDRTAAAPTCRTLSFLVTFLSMSLLVACSDGSEPARLVSSSDTNQAEDLRVASTEGASTTAAPTTVTDLSVTSAGVRSVTLEWTGVDDGASSPADYQIRFAATPIGYGWGDATVAAEGSCASPINGGKVDATVSCTVEGLDPDHSYDFQLVAFREKENGDRAYSENLSNVATAETYSGIPGTVDDLSSARTTASSVTLGWTEVADGAGSPALYEVRYNLSSEDHNWGSATVVKDGSCGLPVKGREIGGVLTCTMEGLEAATSYDFQLVTFRKKSDGSRAYSAELSDVVTTRTSSGVPATVDDLSAIDATSTSATLEWTAVDDGTGTPALYEMRRAPTPIEYGWGDAEVVTDGECDVTPAEVEIGSTITCTATGLSSDASHDFQLVSYREGSSGSRTYGEELSNVATAETKPEAPTNPATVADLSVSTTSPSSATLTWTEVDDGSGAPAAYEIRYALTPLGYGWGDATVTAEGSCASPVAGSGIGGARSCTVEGLEASTSYDFQLVAFREESDGSRVYSEDLSNVATGLTAEAVTDDGGSADDGTTDGGVTDDGGSGDTGSGSGAFPAEPDGFSSITETSYSSAGEDGWSASSELGLIDDASAPWSPNTVGEAHYPAGWTGGHAPIWSERGISGAGARRLYVSFWLKVSDNWQGHSVNDKIVYLWTHEKPVVFPVYVGGGSNPLRTEIRIQDTPDGARNLAANLTDTEIQRGVWHRWEIVVDSNTGDAADGEIHWWIDGRKVGEHTDIRFGTSSQAKIWNYVVWRPVWGGSGGTIMQDQYMWMDHTYVSGAP